MWAFSTLGPCGVERFDCGEGVTERWDISG